MTIWRFEGSAVCDFTAWVEGDTQEEALAKIPTLPDGELHAATTARHIRPRLNTVVIDSIRESTGDNP